jgi:hypothetical protein
LLKDAANALIPRLQFGLGDSVFRRKGRCAALVVFRNAVVKEATLCDKCIKHRLVVRFA